MSMVEYGSTFILNHNSPKINQPVNIKTSLKDHQKASVERMLYMEDNRDIKNNFKNTNGRSQLSLWESSFEQYENSNSSATNMNLNCGVICNPVGSGKSLIILALIAQKKIVDLYEKKAVISGNFGPYLNFTHDMRKNRITINSNLLIVPHPIYYQWYEYCKYDTKLKVMYIKGKGEINLIEGLINDEICNNEEIAGHKFMGYLALSNIFSKYDIILVKSTAFRDFISNINYYSHSLSNKVPLLVWSRFIVDEINSIELPNNKFIRANYTWFITSSVVDLFNFRIKKNGFLKSVWKNMVNTINYDSSYVYNSLIDIPDNIISINKETYDKYVNDAIKEIFKALYTGSYYYNNKVPLKIIVNYYKDNLEVIDEFENNIVPITFIANMIVRCSDKFIRDSWKLPEVIHNEIQCKTPVVLDVLKGLVDSKVLEMINAGDINGAISHVNGIGIQDTTSIVEAVTTTLINDRHNLEALLEYKKNKIFHSFEDKNEAISRVQEKLDSVNIRIKSIEDKISNYKESKCPICWLDYDKPVLLGCNCSTLFCFECITSSLKHAQSKENKSCPMCRGKIKGITLISESEIKKDDEMEVDTIKNKNTTMKELILDAPHKKYLVFSNSGGTFKNLHDEDDVEQISTDSAGLHYTKVFDYYGVSAAIPKGSTSSINKTIEKFNRGEINILFLNIKHFGHGLNLEQADEVILFHKMTSDEEKQAIGRAQRPGRTTQLRVYHLLHDNET
jgi:hypothetical protein